MLKFFLLICSLSFNSMAIFVLWHLWIQFRILLAIFLSNPHLLYVDLHSISPLSYYVLGNTIPQFHPFLSLYFYFPLSVNKNLKRKIAVKILNCIHKGQSTKIAISPSIHLHFLNPNLLHKLFWETVSLKNTLDI